MSNIATALSNSELEGSNLIHLSPTGAADAYKKFCGLESLELAAVFESMANLKGRQKKYDHACVMLEETLRIRMKLLDSQHEVIGRSLYSLGVAFNKKCEYDASIKALTKCLHIQERRYKGEDTAEVSDIVLFHLHRH